MKDTIETYAKLFDGATACFGVGQHETFLPHQQETALLGFSRVISAAMEAGTIKLCAWVVDASYPDFQDYLCRRRFLNVQNLRCRLLALQTFPALKNEWDWLESVGVVFARQRLLVAEAATAPFTVNDIFFGRNALSAENVARLQSFDNIDFLTMLATRAAPRHFKFMAMRREGQVELEDCARATEAFECLFQGSEEIFGEGERFPHLATLDSLGFSAYKISDFIDIF